MTNSLVELAEIMIKTPLLMAKSDRENIVPIIGAGVSVPLGLPNWHQLINNLCKQANFEITDSVDMDPPDLLEEIMHKIGETVFTNTIQQLLTLSDTTTSTLQALASTSIKKFITTNLDLAIETAFVKAQKPLRPENVGRGSSLEELSMFDHVTNNPILLKIHGSIERPSTWVLTRNAYDKAYIEPGHLKRFLSTKVSVPLFIGFSFSDFDINESLRLAKLSQQKKAYTIINIDQAKRLYTKFKSIGVIPIGFYTYDQIPEIIDEIFFCSPIKVEAVTLYDNKNDTTRLQVGGAKIQLSNSVVSDEKKFRIAVDILSNAFEVQPNESIISGRPRREHGQKGAYRRDIISILKSDNTNILEPILFGMAQYPEIFESLINSLLRKEEVEQFPFFNLIFNLFPQSSYEEKHIEQILLSNLHNPDLSYQCLRDIAKITSIIGVHPACRVPSVTTQVGQLLVPIFPLTRYQVAVLMGRNISQIEHPCRPYTIHSIQEAHEVIRRLSKLTNQSWYLPTETEWRTIAGVDGVNRWPWGDEDPLYKVHAHLRYIIQGGSVANHPLEVGIFPKGKSITGLYDLIGNTYELVSAGYNTYHLAGGAWTTTFKAGSMGKFSLISGWSRGKENIGIRPVCKIEHK